MSKPSRQSSEADLEARVDQRTAELVEANRRLKAEIAARRDAEARLRESESRFRLLAENATDLIARHAPDGRFLWVSPSSERLLGYKPEEMIGRSPYDFFHPDDAPSIRDAHDRLLGQAAQQTNEYRFRRKDGSYVWFQTHSRRVTDPTTGEVVELHSTSRDMTERYEWEQRLRLVESAVEQADDMIMITDADLDPPGPRIMCVNPAFTRTTGYTPEEVIGKTPRILQGPRTSRPLLDVLRRQLSCGQRFEGETINYRKDGSEFILHWHIDPVRDATGRITHWVSIQRDVTAEREAEAQLRQRQAELAHVSRLATMGEMVSGLAHELNQPLAAISIYVQGSLRRVQARQIDCAELEDALSRVAGQAQRASEVIRRLRNFVRKREPKRARETVDELIRGTVVLMEAELRQQSVTLHVEVPADLPAVWVDTVQIEQVLLNLARNAIDAMEAVPPAERALTIRAGALPDGRVEIAVSDTGPGISPGQLPHIFEPFYTTKAQGMGMGLNISQSIVEDHGGRLEAVPNPDRGVTFRMILPPAA